MPPKEVHCACQAYRLEALAEEPVEDRVLREAAVGGFATCVIWGFPSYQASEGGVGEDGASADLVGGT